MALKITKLSILGIVLLGAASFAGGVSAAETRIGVINMLRILEGAPQAEKARVQLEKEFAPRDRELVGRQKEIKKLVDRLTKDAAIMSETERTRMERDIRKKRGQFKRDQDEYREDINIRQTEELRSVQKKVDKAIRGVAKDQKFDIILGQGVIFASERVDITKDVLARLKKITK